MHFFSSLIFTLLFFSSFSQAMHVEPAARQKMLDNQLLEACFDGDYQQVRFLLENRANVNAEDRYCGTALYCAIAHNQFKIANHLLQYKPKVNTTTLGISPLIKAVANAKSDIDLYLIQKLLDQKAEIKSELLVQMLEEEVNSMTPALFNMLIQYGADIESKNLRARIEENLSNKKKYKTDVFAWLNIIVMAKKNQLIVDKWGRPILVPQNHDEKTNSAEIIPCTCFQPKVGSVLVELGCHHEFCKECLKKRIELASIFDDESALSCPFKDCHHQFTSNDISKFCDKDTRLINTFNQFRENENCKICYKTKKKKEFGLISCAHKVCENCLKDHVRSAENNSNNDTIRFITCPVKNCLHKFTDEEVKNFSDGDLSLMNIFYEVSAKVKCLSCSQFDAQTNFYKLSCGHDSFCKNCLRNQISAAHMNFGRKKFFNCMYVGCGGNLTKGQVEELTQDDTNIVAIYDKWHCVSDHPNSHKLCPTPDCGEWYELPYPARPIVICRLCNAQYCGYCQKKHSEKMTCDTYKEFQDLTPDKIDERNKSFIEWCKKNTKLCPTRKCGFLIEKISGCDKMECAKCNKIFYWNCVGFWSNDQTS